MAIQRLPGFQGVMAMDVSSVTHAGKFTDANALSRLGQDNPTMYDREIISLYSQTTEKASDFMNMLNKSTPFYINSNTDSWSWKVNSPWIPNRLVEITPSTASNINSLGVDGKPFEMVFDRPFQLNAVVSANKMYGDALLVVTEPRPYGKGYLVEVELTGASVNKNSVAQSRFIVEGHEYSQIDFITGEFDQDLDGIDIAGHSITLMDSMGAGYGVQHTTTKWAGQRTLKDEKGNLKDIVAYTQYKINEMGKPEVLGVRWETYAERKAREKMLMIRTNRILWAKGGQSQARGGKQEVRKHVEGIYSKMKRFGQYNDFNKGQFSGNLLRQVFGDLFYRRVEIGKRRVKLYTNEAGMELFRQANLDDLKASGLTIIADNRFIQGTGQNMMVNYGFDMMFSWETGTVEVSHLVELDLADDYDTFAINRKSPPIFYAFDITNPEGGLQNNIREVRQQGAPSMTWGYINGRQDAVKGNMYGGQSASMNPGSTLWFEDRFDIFIEDFSKVVVFEQTPQI